jgi:high-affinity Fe2+/Pb2+ permease
MDLNKQQVAALGAFVSIGWAATFMMMGGGVYNNSGPMVTNAWSALIVGGLFVGSLVGMAVEQWSQSDKDTQQILQEGL